MKPIEIECPACRSKPGQYCTDGAVLDYHHAERVDAAFEKIYAQQPADSWREVRPNSAPDNSHTFACRKCHAPVVVDGVACGDCSTTQADSLRAALAEAVDDLENFVNGLAKNVGEDGGVRLHRRHITEWRKLITG